MIAYLGDDLDALLSFEESRNPKDQEDFRNLFGAPEVHAQAVTEARQCLEYLKNNRRCIPYKTFHAMGLCSSTGVVEAGCKHAVGTRLKRPGMHWTEPGANAIIALRCSRLSGRFESFWERRSIEKIA